MNAIEATIQLPAQSLYKCIWEVQGTHTAMKSGMLAAEAAFAALEDAQSQHSGTKRPALLSAYEEAIRWLIYVPGLTLQSSFRLSTAACHFLATLAIPARFPGLHGRCSLSTHRTWLRAIVAVSCVNYFKYYIIIIITIIAFNAHGSNSHHLS